MVDGRGVEWRDRAQFFAVSAQIMRRILVDAARGDGWTPCVNADEVAIAEPEREGEIVAVDEAPEGVRQV